MNDTFIHGLGELDFVDAYCDTTLRKPQVVADSALRTLVLASQADRLLMTAVIAEQLAEACRRLVQVFDALEDRTRPVAVGLTRPLPDVEGWKRFAQLAATLPPEALVARMSLGSAAAQHAERLRGLGDFSLLTEVVGVVSSPNPLVLISGNSSSRHTEVLLVGIGREGAGVALDASPEEDHAAALAELTAEISAVGRGFLGAYLEARRGAGRGA